MFVAMRISPAHIEKISFPMTINQKFRIKVIIVATIIIRLHMIMVFLLPYSTNILAANDPTVIPNTSTKAITELLNSAYE